MANILILYATRQGQTRKIAARIADQLSVRTHDVEVVDADHPRAPLDVGRFDTVVIAAPIIAGGYPRSIVRFAREHRRELHRTSSVFVSVGLAVASRKSDGRAQSLAVVERFVEKTSFHPGRIELVAGALPYSKYDILTRFVMRRIAGKEGGDTDTSRDYEYTDWGAVDRFARDLVPAGPLESNAPLPVGVASAVPGGARDQR